LSEGNKADQFAKYCEQWNKGLEKCVTLARKLNEAMLLPPEFKAVDRELDQIQANIRRDEMRDGLEHARGDLAKCRDLIEQAKRKLASRRVKGRP